jgi:hypothetical protein
MLPAEARIIGIASCEFDAAAGSLWLRMQLSDGSIAACWWGVHDLTRFMAVVSPPTRAPLGAAIN